MKKLFLIGLVAASLGLVGCSNDTSSNGGSQHTGGDTSSTMTNQPTNTQDNHSDTHTHNQPGQ